jgi:alpha-1,3-glucosyltransferase
MYAVVLNFKHIYLYSAPAFGILYVRQLILLDTVPWQQKIRNFVQLAVQTVVICLLSFGPFLLQADPVG